VRSSRYTFCPRCRTALVTAERGDRDRLICPAADCGFVHWDNPVPIVAAIVERDDEVVLVRSRGWPESWYGLVAGFLETGETPEHAILREIREEIGVEARLVEQIGVYPFTRLNQVIFVYHAQYDDGEIVLCETELADFKRVPVERLKPWPEGTGPAVRDWLGRRGLDPEVVAFGTPID
jgi:NAD+ diphosphatase